jgi:hypothetical protein
MFKVIVLALLLVGCGHPDATVTSIPTPNIQPIPISPFPNKQMECSYYLEGYKAGCLALAIRHKNVNHRTKAIKFCYAIVKCPL